MSDLPAIEAWLPAGLCLLGYPEADKSGIAPADSNGLATGPTLQDALFRGFCEVVERDATAIWWYNRLVLPRIEPASLENELVLLYATWLRSQFRELRLLRLTLDLPIPVVAAISHHVSGRDAAFGFGAGPSMAAATVSAVGELAQCERTLGYLKGGSVCQVRMALRLELYSYIDGTKKPTFFDTLTWSVAKPFRHLMVSSMLIGVLPRRLPQTRPRHFLD
ncbi:YcaO-like family protein [Mesorhizobium calcicola]|uniref:YcaO-like family protein n=1 Tax=Mesorhizobium calcicola TaxID=1300310 RepID=A0ABW4WPV6_9HYPH